MDSTQPILYSVSAGVGTIVLNRPEVLNSLNRNMALEFQAALSKAEADPQVRTILLTAAGKAFCAGQDLSEVTPKSDGTVPDLGVIVAECYNPIIAKLCTIEKPVVCAVNGVAAGAGANLALACDIVIAAKEASFIQSFVKVGLIPDSGGTCILPRLVGYARAKAMTLLAEKTSAETAVSIGMIYKAVEAANLLEEAKKIAESLASMPTYGVGLTKRGFNLSWNNSVAEQLKVEEELQRDAGRSNDYKEGVMAFIEKRAAKFVGR